VRMVTHHGIDASDVDEALSRVEQAVRVAVPS
jgi:hypothetical protein